MERKATPEKEDFGKKYKETNFISKKLLDGYFKSVEKLIREIPGSNLNTTLEIGCGEGYSTAIIKTFLPNSCKFEASEYVENLVPVAQSRNPGLKIVQEDVYKMDRKDNSFDLVFLLEVLEHLDYPDKALEEIKRIDSNYLILGVPREPIWRVLNMARGKYLKDFGNTTGHLNHWGRRGIIKFVEKNFGPVIKVKNPLPWTILLAKKVK